ncbi:hypothetical protein GUJ93_ZPchr0004g39693 [Zizania palustris]|uniref:Uncharacterized protein n=1 Tax=Zizania palustris TaxID=103762 RepID=A0A8J5S5R0_ZIZPA|nr:hypothetical protein GUJ93_ZPchr0004g39693 [Zizania palustris]
MPYPSPHRPLAAPRHSLCTRLTLSQAATTRKALSTTGVPAEAADDYTFIDVWKNVAPNFEAPKTPSSRMQPHLPTPVAIPSKLTINFVVA